MQGKLKRRLRMLCAAVTSAVLVLCVVGGMSPAMAALGKPIAMVGEKVFAFDGAPHYTTVTPPSDEYEVYYSTSKLTIANAKDKGSKEPISRVNAGKNNVYYAIVPVSETPSVANSVVGYFSLQVTKGSMATVTVSPIPDQPLVAGGVKPELTVTDANGYVLELGRDYSVRWANNTKVGTGKVTVAGYGNYSGSVIARFTIYDENTRPANEHSTEGAVPTYTWSGSGSDPSNWTCTATIPCTARGHSDIFVANGVVERTNHTEATCEAPGSSSFKATFDSEWASEQVYVIEEPALGHIVAEPVWNWADNGKTAVATITCPRCGNAESDDAYVTSKVVTKATCTEGGSTTYTGNAWIGGKRYVAVKTVDDVAARGHSYVKTENWAADRKSVTVSSTCSVCASASSFNVQIGEAIFAYDGEAHPVVVTCDNPGYKVYYSASSFSVIDAATKGSVDPISVKDIGSKYIHYAVVPVDEKPTVKNSISGSILTKITKTGIANVSVAPIPDQPWLVGGVEPKLHLTDPSGYELVLDKDYSLQWFDNDKLGTATVKINGYRSYSGSISKNFTVSRDVHYYQGVTYEWNGEGFDPSDWTCTATHPCIAIEHTDALTPTVTAVQTDYVPPICTAEGSITIKASFDEEWAEDQYKTLYPAALGHDYGPAVFAWAADGKSATVSFSCSRGDDVQHRDADITSELTAPATCTANGTTTYTAKVTFGGSEYSATKDVADIPMLGHDFNAGAIAFAEDGKSATATFDCSRCDATEEKAANVSSAVKAEAACTEKGWTTYTATATSSTGKEIAATKDVQDIAVLGHNFDSGSISFAADGKSATATFDCSRCVVTEQKAASVSSAVKTEPTCTAKGWTTYTATATSSTGKEITATKDVQDIAVLGHNFDTATFAFADDGKSATATFDCSRCDATEDKVATITSAVKIPATCEGKGTTTYTAKATSSTGTEKSATKDVVDIAATGHDYNAGTIAFAADGKTATATFTCANGCGVNEEKAASVTNAVKTPSTCTVKGWTTYTATATSSNNKVVSATKDVQDIAVLGHNFDTATFAFADDGKSATATFDCSRCDATEDKTAAITSAVKIPATCEGKGTTTYTAKATSSTGTEKSATKDVVDIAATGHDYNAGTIAFAADGKTATATFTCANGCGVNEEKAATITSAVKTPATCTVKGWTTYTATATSSTGKEIAATKDVQDIAVLGHNFDSATFNFAADGKSATATFDCSRCDATEDKAATITSAVKIPATCEGKGTTTYTAKATSSTGTEKSATKDVVDIAATGHDYNAGTIAFAADGKTATATFTCANGCGVTEEKAATVTSAVKTPATCTVKGWTTYTATATSSTGKEIAATKDVQDIAVLGHNFDSATFNFAADGKSATATFNCSRCDATEDKVATITSKVKTAATCEVKGTTTYTASATSSTGTTKTGSKDVQDIAALGHNYNAATFAWTGTSSAKATFTCSRCSGTEEKAATITSKVTTPATCTVKGTTTYTASATSSTGTTKTDTKTAQDVAALGHNYNAGTIAFAADGKSATATFTCANGCGVNEEKAASVTNAVKTPATCTAKGWTTYTASATSSNNKVVSATKDVQDIAVLGHNFDTAIFAFADDGKSATATFDCSRCDATEEKAATITSKVKTAATCEVKGTTTYTAKATSSTGTEKSATKDVVDIAALGHNFDTATFNFAADGKSATATFDCSRCDATEDKVAAITSAVKVAATCEVNGTTTYTAKATSSTGTEKSGTKDIADIPAIGHNYNAGTVNFAADGKSATATFTCANGCGVNEVKAASVTSAVKTAATCDAKGTTTYTAAVTSSTGKDVSATKDVTDIAVLGHDYSVLQSAQVNATCTADGKTAVYKCSRCSSTSGGATIASPGHSYSSVTSYGACSGSVTTYTCSRCSDTYSTGTKYDSHNLSYYSGSSATCTSGGWTSGYYCTRCNYDESSYISPLGHTDVGAPVGKVLADTPDSDHCTLVEYCGRCGGERERTVMLHGNKPSYEHYDDSRHKVVRVCPFCWKTLSSSIENHTGDGNYSFTPGNNGTHTRTDECTKCYGPRKANVDCTGDGSYRFKYKGNGTHLRASKCKYCNTRFNIVTKNCTRPSGSTTCKYCDNNKTWHA